MLRTIGYYTENGIKPCILSLATRCSHEEVLRLLNVTEDEICKKMSVELYIQLCNWYKYASTPDQEEAQKYTEEEFKRTSWMDEKAETAAATA